MFDLLPSRIWWGPVSRVKVIALKGKYPPEEGDQWTIICSKDDKEVSKWSEFWRGRVMPTVLLIASSRNEGWWESSSWRAKRPDKATVITDPRSRMSILPSLIRRLG